MPRPDREGTITNADYFLTCLMEECLEISEQAAQVGIRVSKALRFGLDEIQAGQMQSNLERLASELADLLGTVEVLVEAGVIGSVDAKKKKIGDMLAYSIKCGVVS